ncbi:transcriptional regulator [Oleomonas cavernae]|uniref:Transcriptional regulator n=1 Tax=Oleomonas cavernae TaxID=2320859 RepID=A0A418W8G5_9PROT|nr:winged helix-turn-helix transcriptional regulator [Oleomonas cavernae]RJF86292.1 transcriptional regulator [Oleomonas cavernae]
MKSSLPLPGQKVRGSRTGRPVMAALDLLGRRGALRLIWELREGRVLTFRALAAACDLPPATLNARIKELREAMLIAPEDGYRLTPLGVALFEAFAPFERWSRHWAKAVPGLIEP